MIEEKNYTPQTLAECVIADVNGRNVLKNIISGRLLFPSIKPKNSSYPVAGRTSGGLNVPIVGAIFSLT